MSRGPFNQRSADTVSSAGGFTSLVTAFDPYFNALTSDVTQAAVGTSTLCTVTTAVTTQSNRIQVWSSLCFVLTAGGAANAFISVDGVTKVSERIENIGAGGQYYQCALNWSDVVLAGAHTVLLRISVAAGTAFCRPATAPDNEFANLTVNVLNIGI